MQNIDLMNLAGFCRNCLSNWYQEAAAERGLDLGKDAARQIVYGMPYKEWQQRYQTEASPARAGGLRQIRRRVISHRRQSLTPTVTRAPHVATKNSSGWFAASP